VYKVLVEKPEWKVPLRRLKGRWNDNFKMNLVEIEREGVDWIHVAKTEQWPAVANHGNEPSDSIKGEKFLYRLSGC
jgi:hypothetical protein